MTTTNGIRTRKPLLEDAYQDRKEAMESTYIRRGSDQKVALSIDKFLNNRDRWISERDGARHAKSPDTPRPIAKPDWGVETRDAKSDRTSPKARFETRGIIITGASGAGKTRLLNGALSGHPRLVPRNERHVPMLFQQVPGPCSLLSLGWEILDTLRFPVAPSAKEKVVWRLVRQQLALADVQVLHLDEIQNVLETANVLETRNILNALKTLMNHPVHPVILVMSGLSEFAAIAEAEEQIQRRCLFTPLETIGPAQVSLLAKAVAEMARRGNLSVEEGIEERIMPRLIHACHGLVGLSMEFAVGAALQALRPYDRAGGHLPPDETLGMAHFAAEYAYRTSNAAFANPFIADDWHLLDTRRVNILTRAQLAAPKGSSPRRKRHGRKGDKP